MEEQKIDKRTKEYKLQKSEDPIFDELKATGIPIKMAMFHRNVRSWTGEPETAFYVSGAKPSRTATMWLTPHFLLCEQKGGYTKLIPLANVSDTIV